MDEVCRDLTRLIDVSEGQTRDWAIKTLTVIQALTERVILAEQRASQVAALRELVADIVEWNHLYGYPRGDEWDAIEARATTLAAASAPLNLPSHE